MALANGVYPVTITATRSDGVTNTITTTITIGDDVISQLGFISNQQVIHPLLTNVVADLGFIALNKDIFGITTNVSGNIVAVLGAISTVKTVQPITTETEQSLDVVSSLGTITLSKTPFSITTVVDTSGTTLTSADINNIVNAIFSKLIESDETFLDQLKLIRANAAGNITRTVVGQDINITIKDSTGQLNRVSATISQDGQRTITGKDVS